MNSAEKSRNMTSGMFGGDKLALARAISAVENEHESAAGILNEAASNLGHARIIGITGPPGAGKSTLTSALIGAFRERGLSVGVIAVDPSSPLTGGAILGDRIRMTKYSDDEGVFVRSLASRGSVGGLSRATSKVAHVMDAARFDIILIETVGAGQSEVDIMEHADVTIVVSAPGLGDEIQAFKAGILEIADILVVNKADLEHADITVQQLKGSVALGRADGKETPVLRTVATTSEGVEELVEAVLERTRLEDEERASGLDTARARNMLAARASDLVRARCRDDENADLQQLAERLASGELTLEEAGEKAIALVVLDKG